MISFFPIARERDRGVGALPSFLPACLFPWQGVDLVKSIVISFIPLLERERERDVLVLFSLPFPMFLSVERCYIVYLVLIHSYLD